MVILIFFVVHWYFALFSQTFFQHRYASHGAFQMSLFWEKVFYLFAYVTQGSSYMSPRSYGIMHRLHHAYTDTEKDPHSPKYSANVFAMMWRTRTVYQQIVKGKANVEERFLKGLPDWRGFDRWAGSGINRLLWVTGYVVFYIYFATSPWLYLLLPVTIAMGAVHGAIINWFAHKYGYINYKLHNTSENLFSPDILMLGESYHNNHHKHPSAINFGVKWYEFDPVYPVIRLMKWLHIIRISAPIPLYSKGMKLS